MHVYRMFFTLGAFFALNELQNFDDYKEEQLLATMNCGWFV